MRVFFLSLLFVCAFLLVVRWIGLMRPNAANGQQTGRTPNVRRHSPTISFRVTNVLAPGAGQRRAGLTSNKMRHVCDTPPDRARALASLLLVGDLCRRHASPTPKRPPSKHFISIRWRSRRVHRAAMRTSPDTHARTKKIKHTQTGTRRRTRHRTITM